MAIVEGWGCGGGSVLGRHLDRGRGWWWWISKLSRVSRLPLEFKEESLERKKGHYLCIPMQGQGD